MRTVYELKVEGLVYGFSEKVQRFLSSVVSREPLEKLEDGAKAEVSLSLGPLGSLIGHVVKKFVVLDRLEFSVRANVPSSI